MGYSYNWLAVEGADEAALLERLGMEETGWVSDPFSSKYVCATLASGWTIVFSGDFSLKLDRQLRAASAEGLAIGCEVEERVMFSRCLAFRQGAQAWSITRDAEKQSDGLIVEGVPPPPFAEIRDRLLAEDAADDEGGVDYLFNAPQDLAKALCGHVASARDGNHWRTLELAGKKRVSWQPSPSIPEAFRTDLTPLLTSLGWRSALDQSEGPPVGAYDVMRVHKGRRQTLWLTWEDHAGAVSFVIGFVVSKADVWGQGTVVNGVMEVPSDTRPRSLWPFGRKRSAPEEERAEFIASLRRRILIVDAFLSRGETDPAITLYEGAAEDLT